MSIFRGKCKQATQGWSIEPKKSSSKQFLGEVESILKGSPLIYFYFLAKNARFFEEIVDFQHEDLI